MPYVLTLKGREFKTDDLTFDEAIVIERETGRPWTRLNPFQSAADWKAIAVAFLSREMAEDQAKKEVGTLTITEGLNATKIVEDDLPDSFEDGLPKAEGGDSSTSTSSSSRGRRGSGRQT